MLTGKGEMRWWWSDSNESKTRYDENRPWFLMPPRPLTHFEIQKYCQSEPKFNGAYPRNNLPKIKDGANVINLDEYESIETHWIALYVNGNNMIYCDCFGVELIPKEI